MKLADFGAGRHDGRRQYEWKVTLGLWAAIVAGIAIFRGQTPPAWVGLLAWVGPPIVLLYGFLWLRGVWVANEKDKKLSFHYRSQAQKLLVDPSHAVMPAAVAIPWHVWLFGFLFDWSMLFQLAATVGLLALAYLFIYFK